MTRREEIATRVELLKRDFDRYVKLFELERPFGNPVSHRRTLGWLGMADSPSQAIANDEFVQSLWLTLSDWGMNTRAAELAPLATFGETLRRAAPDIDALKELAIDSVTTSDLSRLWQVVAEIAEVTNNKAKLVSCTKTLHHLLPDLFVPIDRQYTAVFFRWWGPELQNDQQRVFERTYEVFANIAVSQDLTRFLDDDWNTSRGKVIDNAIIGFVLAMRSARPEMQVNVADTQQRLAEFAEERDWMQFHTPKNLVMALAAEAGELLEIFQWSTDTESERIASSDEGKQQVSEELADVMIYALRLADVLDIPLAEAIALKMDANALKYPVELAKGNAIKYSRREHGKGNTPASG